MTRHWLGRLLFWGALAAGLWLGTEHAAAQTVRLETAELGATGRFGGSSVTEGQFIGWRFELDTPLAVEQIGAHMLQFEPGGLFAALVELDSLDAIPHGLPFTDDEVIATTVIQAPLPSAEVMVPLAATLRPGSYALVFGTGYFGASGRGALPNFDDQPDIPPTDISSFIYWSRPSMGAPLEWRENLGSHMRVILEGEVLQIDGDYNLDGDVDEADFALWRDEFGAQNEPLVDGNESGRVDSADYTVWRDNLGARVENGSGGAGAGGAGSGAAVPEPASVVLLLVGSAMYLLGRRTGSSITLPAEPA